MAKKTLIDTPLAELTFRKYEKPENLTRRDLVKKFCLSIGLLQPGDSRDIIVDILYVLIENSKKEKFLGSEEIKDLVIDFRKKNKLQLVGVASSNVRRQLKRLRDLFIIEKIKNKYRISEFMKLSDILQDKVLQYLLPSIISRVKEYSKEIDQF